MAFVPCLIWRFASKRSGVNMAAVMDAARHCSHAHYLEIREKAIRYVVNQMDRYLLAQREYRTGCMVRIKHIIAKFCCIVGGIAINPRLLVSLMGLFVSTLGDRAFAVAGPRVWNNLPDAICHSSSLAAFKRSLKSHLFTLRAKLGGAVYCNRSSLWVCVCVCVCVCGSVTTITRYCMHRSSPNWVYR